MIQLSLLQDQVAPHAFLMNFHALGRKQVDQWVVEKDRMG